MNSEKWWDEKLNIRTNGRDASFEDRHHYPYEPTPYGVLQLLAESRWIGKEDLLVDYGCGKGRVSFFMAAMSGCRSIGIDFNPQFILTAEQNLADYRGEKSRITFLAENAEHFAPPEEADRFYFFNPFSEKILQAVIRRILDSWYRSPRLIRMFFYYPSDEYAASLMTVEELAFVDEIDCSGLFPGDRRERILVFEL